MTALATLGWGTFQDAQGTAQSGVAYVIKNAAGTTVLSGTTSASGQLAGSLNPGKYTLSVPSASLSLAVEVPPSSSYQMTTGYDGLTIQAATDGTIRNMALFVDPYGAPIGGVQTAGGLFINDQIRTLRDYFGFNPFESNIYFSTKTNKVNHSYGAGPPGNQMRFEDACFEQYEQSRLPSTGTWQSVYGTVAVDTVQLYAGQSCTNAPDQLFVQGRFTSAVTGAWSAVTENAAAGIPSTAAATYTAMASVRSASVSRQTYVSIDWYDSSGTFLSSTDGTATATPTTAWTKITVSGTAPASTAFRTIKISALATTPGEIVYADAVGSFPGTNLVWSPPEVNQPGSGVWTGAVAGDRRSRTDTPSTANQREYVCTTGGIPKLQVWQGYV